MKTKFFFIVSLITMTFFISCNPSDNTGDNPNPSTPAGQALTDSKIDASIEDVSNIVGDQFSIKQISTTTGRSTATMRTYLPTCAAVSWIYANGIFTGSIDFGTEGCTLANGNVLKGKITVTFSGNFTTPEQTITYSFDGFYHNGNKLQGSRTITRTLKSTELLATQHLVFNCTVDMTIVFADGSVYTRKGNRVKELVNDDADNDGDLDDGWEDNVFLVTGTETTTVPNGDTWTNTIQKPLRFEMECKRSFPVSGTILKVKSGVETLVDFGAGECDNIATVTTNGVTTTIEYKK